MRDPEIKKLQNLRNTNRFEAHKSRDSSIWDTFRQNKRDIKRAIRHAKSDFYRNALSKKKPKKVWKIIHSVLHPPPTRCTFSPSELNNYFVEIAGKILNKEPTQPSKILEFIESLPNSSRENGAVFQLRQVSYENVLKQLKALRNDTSTGPDGIPVRYIKLVQDSLSSPLTHIINAFIESNNFPSSWKCARIVPINKVPTPVEKSDFRPIAILPALSKIFERLVCSQVIEFIENTHLYKDTVTGFRKGYSTGSALLKLRDDIRTAMKSGELSIIVLIDFSKAFDTISHETLIQTLHKCDFSKDFMRWTLSYLTNRKQFIQIDDKTSKKMTNLFGVPQGSILGPLFFNLYVNGLQDTLPSKTIQYADDTTVYTSCKPNYTKQRET